MALGWALLAGMIGAPAWAQSAPAEDDPPPEEVVVEPAGVIDLGVLADEEDESEPPLNFDRLLVATVRPSSEGLRVEAQRIHQLMEEALAVQNVTVPMAEVPDFDDKGYDASTYLLACPDGSYPGCALVVGQRAEADWVIGGTLRRAEAELDEPLDLEGDVTGEAAPALELTVTFVDIHGGQEILSFTVRLDESNDEDVIQGIAVMFNQILAGSLEQIDVRGDLEDPMLRAQRDQARAKLIASSIAQLESTLGPVDPREALGALQAPKITRAQLEEYRQREDVAPWIKLKMSENDYLRYRNSGLDLDAWRRRAAGRQGQVLLRVGYGAGRGAYAHTYEGRLARDGETLEPVEVAQVQEAVQGSNGMLWGELGVGVLPWLEVGGRAGMRTSTFTIFVDEETEGQINVEGSPTETRVTSQQFGGYVGFAPFPHKIVRPTTAVGAVAWQGKSFKPDSSSSFRKLASPRQVFLDVAPGLEVAATQGFQLFARGAVELPLGGQPVDQHHEGEGSLQTVPRPSHDRGVGWSVQAGVLVRIGVLRPSPARGRGG